MSDEQLAALAETVESVESESVESKQPEQKESDSIDEDESAKPEESTTSEEGKKTGENSDEDASAEQTQKKKSGVQKRIDELTAKRIEVERERDYYKKLAEQQNAKQPITSEPQLPSFDDYDYDHEKFAEAMQEYAEQKAEWLDYQKNTQLTERQKQLESQKRQWKYQDACNDFAKNQSDFFSVTTNPNLPITQEMTEVILDSGTGPELAYYLGKNPDLALQISQLPTHLQYKEMGRIEYELTSKKPPANTLTKAPEPIKPLGNKSNVERSLAEMDYDEFVKAREKQIAARRR